MVSSCCIKNCPTVCGQGFKLHKIPKNVELRSKWLKFIHSIDKFFVLKPSHLVCENHFSENDYTIPITSMSNRRLLNKNAVPSNVGIICIDARRSLNFQPNMDEMYNGLVEDVKPDISSDIIIDNTIVDTINDDKLIEEITVDPKPISLAPLHCTNYTPRKRKVFFGDFKSPDDIECPKSRLKYWHASQSVVLEQKKKLKMLTKENDNLRITIKNLTKLVEHLNKEKKLFQKTAILS